MVTGSRMEIGHPSNHSSGRKVVTESWPNWGKKDEKSFLGNKSNLSSDSVEEMFEKT